MAPQPPIDDAPQQPTAAPAPATKPFLARRPWLLALALAVVTFAAYQPTWHAGFIWDDNSLIADNPLVRARSGLWRFWFTTEAPDYWPLTSSAWWLEWRLWHNHPAGYHAVNVLLHAINAVLVWAILRRLKVPGAWLAACVFALHPVNVATVAWISEQKNTLSMLFYAIAILLYLRFDEDGDPRWQGLSLAAFLLALLSKTAVVMLPVVLLGCIWWRRGKVRREDFLRCLPFFVVSLVMGLVTVWYQYPRAAGGRAIPTEGFLTRLAVAGSTPWFYLYKTLLPINLTVIYPKWAIDASAWTSYAPGIMLLGCFALFWWTRKSWGRPLLFGLGCFVATLFPVLGFFHQSYHMHSFVADHWLYHSIAAVIALVVAAGVEICRRLGHWGRSVGVLAGVAVLIALGAATWSRSSLYADSEALWRDNLARNPNAWVAHNNLGSALENAGRRQEGIGQYEQALRLNPDSAEAHCNLGTVFLQEGKVSDAIAHLEQALRIRHVYYEAHFRLGDALVRSGRATEAIEHYQQALRINPYSFEVRDNLGSALVQTGRINEAIEQYERALRIKPDNAEAHNSLGNLFLKEGKASDAEREFQQALRIKPDYAKALNNQANSLLRAGRVEEAIGLYEQTLRIEPNSAEVHYNLGVALELAGRMREAIEHWKQALRIRPDYAKAQNKLARLPTTPPPAEVTAPGNP